MPLSIRFAPLLRLPLRPVAGRRAHKLRIFENFRTFILVFWFLFLVSLVLLEQGHRIACGPLSSGQTFIRGSVLFYRQGLPIVPGSLQSGCHTGSSRRCCPDDPSPVDRDVLKKSGAFLICHLPIRLTAGRRAHGVRMFEILRTFILGLFLGLGVLGSDWRIEYVWRMGCKELPSAATGMG